jgi:hypothetical protein
MKKLMTLAALVAACAPAFTAEVTSSNTVGYQKVNIVAGYNIIGQQFVAPSSDDSAASVQTIVPGEGLDIWGSDSIQTWDPVLGEYTDYYYFGADAGGVGERGAGWGTLSQEELDDTIPAGKAFWANASDDSTVTTSGQVPAGNTVEIAAGYNLVCAPQPIAVDIQSIIPGDGFDIWGSDNIQLWDAENEEYIDFYYFGADAGGVDGEAGWGNLNQEKLDYVIPAGVGFWVNASDDCTFTFPNALSAGNAD